MFQLKVFFALAVAIIFPIVFLKISRLIARVFLKDELSLKKWLWLMRTCMGMVMVVYIVMAANIGKNLISDLYASSSNKQELAPALVSEEDRIEAVAPVKQAKTIHQPFTAEAPDTSHKSLLEAGCIKLGNSRRFRTNWTVAENGLKIIRLGAGPLATAGLQVGDVLTALNGLPIASERELLKIRDDVFTGKTTHAIVTVMRGENKLFFQLEK